MTQTPVRDATGELYRDRMVPKGMARITYFASSRTLDRLREETAIIDLLEEIHAIRVRYSGYQMGLLTVDEWTQNHRTFRAHFTENPDFDIWVTQKALSMRKYHFGIFITDRKELDEEFVEFKTAFTDFRLRTVEVDE